MIGLVPGSTRSVDIGAVVYAHDVDQALVFVDPVHNSVGTVTSGAIAGEIPLKRFADPVQLSNKRAGEEVSDGRGRSRGQARPRGGPTVSVRAAGAARLSPYGSSVLTWQPCSPLRDDLTHLLGVQDIPAGDGVRSLSAVLEMPLE